MLPLKDDIPSRSVPVVTVGLIAMNILAFMYQFSLSGEGPGGGGRAAQELVLEFGLIPCRLTGQCRDALGMPSPFVTVFTSMFMHGGWVHLGGNMLYLWIFGDNVEDRFGHLKFLVFYLLCVPMIGASGAVSGVLGAYLLLFPHARVLTLVTFGFFIRLVRIPALFVLGFWIVVQILNGFLSVGVAAARGQGAGGGVAWFAHIGGFLAGMGLLFVMRPRGASRRR